MKEPKVIFEYDKFFNKIVMKIVRENKIVFYEEVTNDVIKIVSEYQKNNKKVI